MAGLVIYKINVISSVIKIIDFPGSVNIGPAAVMIILSADEQKWCWCLTCQKLVVFKTIFPHYLQFVTEIQGGRPICEIPSDSEVVANNYLDPVIHASGIKCHFSAQRMTHDGNLVCVSQSG